MDSNITPDELTQVALKFAIAAIAFFFGCYINSLPI